MDVKMDERHALVSRKRHNPPESDKLPACEDYSMRVMLKRVIVLRIGNSNLSRHSLGCPRLFNCPGHPKVFRECGLSHLLEIGRNSQLCAMIKSYVAPQFSAFAQELGSILT